MKEEDKVLSEIFGILGRDYLTLTQKEQLQRYREHKFEIFQIIDKYTQSYIRAELVLKEIDKIK